MYCNKNIFFINLLAVVLTFISCSKNPSSPAHQRFSSIAVIVQDEKNKPISGVLAGTYPPTHKRFTDENGQAIIKQIPVGDYQVILYHPDIPLFYKDVSLKANKITDATFIIASKINIYVSVKNY